MSEEIKDSLDKNLDAIKELTKSMKDMAETIEKLKAEWEKWRKAGKF